MKTEIDVVDHNGGGIDEVCTWQPPDFVTNKQY